MLKRLLRQLCAAAHNSPDVKLWPYVWNDGMEMSAHAGKSFMDAIGTQFFAINNFTPKRGKEKFWMAFRDIFNRAKDTESKWDTLLVLQDDLEVRDDFFVRLLDAWNVRKEGPAVINLFTDDTRVGRSIWGGDKPKMVARHGLWRCNWTDPMFFTDRRALESLDYRMEPITNHSPELGSRVGQQLSRRWNAAGVGIFQGIQTFTHHGDHPSMMNPELRKKRPLIA
jgi:hypothetical protein